jgi:hypothetical protein
LKRTGRGCRSVGRYTGIKKEAHNQKRKFTQTGHSRCNDDWSMRLFYVPLTASTFIACRCCSITRTNQLCIRYCRGAFFGTRESVAQASTLAHPPTHTTDEPSVIIKHRFFVNDVHDPHRGLRVISEFCHHQASNPSFKFYTTHAHNRI